MNSVKKIRESNGLTQEKVAKIMGVKREMVSYYESNTREIPVTNLQKLLNFLGIKSEDLKKGSYERKIQVAYRKHNISEENFNQVIWLNRFVMNLSEIKKINE
ncbi:helix-turn-helix transcriptional regulator [Cetobacterium sp. 2A]|uniref:helix-turn-helix domain-containing protein n=1 Tax=Cetobacterium sp. 2A TaxID=2754723 RepID=UPI00163C3380|nr:helix-turn-helix transcriptional regulator [Cetobacterium sp. 2A]MBC2855399.1 helix-turn-helix transcriptional regulator [Cetobacterium sp. 2A]